MKWLVPMAVLLILSACSAALRTTTWDESMTVEVGDCVIEPPEEFDKLEHVSCSRSGAMRVVSVFDLTGYSSIPPVTEFDEVAVERCPASATQYMLPTEMSWDAGDREIVCLEPS